MHSLDEDRSHNTSLINISHILHGPASAVVKHNSWRRLTWPKSLMDEDRSLKS